MKQNKFAFIFLAVFFSFFVLINSAAGAPDIIINEIQLSPIEERFIELYNPTGGEINLTDWYIQRKTQSGNDFTSLVSKTYFENKTIGAHGYFLISRENLNGADIILSNLTLTESNTIQIKKSANEIIDIAVWDKVPEKQSVQRMTDGSWIIATPTPKAQNSNSTSQIATTQQTAPQETQQTNSQSTITNIQTPTSNPPASWRVGGQASNLIANAGENIITIIGQEITFDASKSQGSITSYEWNFGDGQTSKEKIAKHKYNFAGKYIVTLTISDGQNKSQTQVVATIYPTGVYISEFLPSPAGSDENEWIEIYNSNDFIVDISGWKLDDEPASAKATAGKENKFKIPQNTFIAAKNYLVFPRNATKITLNNDNDSVRFYYPEGIVIDEIKYEKAKEGYSASRKPDSTFIWTKNITPSSQNIFLSDSTNTNGSAVSNQSTVKKSENYFAKNLISNANAQIVADDPRENVADITPAPENKNISAHISNATNPKTAGKLFLILTTLGIFVLIWQVIKKR